MNAKVDAYINRSEKWPDEMAALRPVLLGCGLDEQIKWGKPCFGHEGSNIVIMQEMKDFLALMFFKGALLEDAEKVLQDVGPNSRSARRVHFTSVDDVTRLTPTLKEYIGEAIDVEEAGVEVEPAPKEALADELKARLKSDKKFKRAFEALTPGRQREYNLQISSAKQASTREARVEKFAPKILGGKGFRD